MILIFVLIACGPTAFGASGASSATGADWTSSSLVPIQTRVITGDGSQATNYSLIVGTNCYVAPPLSQGGNAGFHLVTLSRQTLALVSNVSYGTNETELGAFVQAIDSLSPTNLVVLSSMGPTEVPVSWGTGFYIIFSSITLGWTVDDFIDRTTFQFAPVYSLIGNSGLNRSEGFELSSLANAQTSGSIEAVLAQDLNGNYMPVQPEFVTIQTSAGSGQDTMLIGTRGSTNSFQAPPLASGTSGGFQLMVLRRDTIHQVATNPAVVLLNQSYPTGGTDLQSSLQAMGDLADDLESFQAQIAGGEVLVSLATLGTPFFNCNSTTCPGFAEFMFLQAFEEIVNRVQTLFGAVGDLENLLGGGYYAVVGLAGSGSDGVPLTVEDRPWTPAQTNSTSLTVLLRMNPKGWFDPVTADTVGGVDYRLVQIAYQPAVPWPLIPAAPGVPEGPCSAGDEACQAYQWVSLQATEQTNPSIRDTYLILNPSELADYASNLNGLAYDPSMSGSFSQAVFDAVTNQLSLELNRVIAVQGLYQNYNQFITDLAVANNSELVNAFSDVVTSVQAPTNSVATLSFDAMLRFCVMLTGTFAPDPVTKAALGVANSFLYVATSLNRTAAGNSDNQLIGAVGDLAGKIAGQFQDSLGGASEVFQYILTDWGKLDLVGRLAQDSADPSNGFAWTTDTATALLEPTSNFYELMFFKALIPTTYQMVLFTNVPFSNPNAYWYKANCSEKFRSQEVTCDCYHDMYTPPASAFFSAGTSISGVYDLFVLATPALGYPSAAMMQTNLPNLNAYLPDLFQGVGMWTGAILPVPPEGWSNYINPEYASYYCLGDFGVERTPEGKIQLVAVRAPGREYVVEWTPSLTIEWTRWQGPVLTEQAEGETYLVLELPIAERSSGYFRTRSLD